jgi:hypothetical protein
MSCITWNQALDFEDQVYALGGFTLMFSARDFQETKSKTDKYFVRGLDGKIASFKEAYPTDAELIDDIAHRSISRVERINVCWVEKPIIPKNLREAWEEARGRWQERK